MSKCTTVGYISIAPFRGSFSGGEANWLSRMPEGEGEREGERERGRPLTLVADLHGVSDVGKEANGPAKGRCGWRKRGQNLTGAGAQWLPAACASKGSASSKGEREGEGEGEGEREREMERGEAPAGTSCSCAGASPS